MKSIVLIFLAYFTHLAIGETYKCIQSGRTTYSSSPCGNDVQVVQDHLTVTKASSRRIDPTPPSVQVEQPQSKLAPVKVALVTNCSYQESEVESVRKVMRHGYPAAQSNYWHERYKKAVDAYERCRKEQLDSLKE